MKSAFTVLALATAANAACSPGQWNTADNNAMLCDQESCGVQCFGNQNCVKSCMTARNPTYDSCAIDCAAAAAGCGLSQCFGACLTGCNDRCVACTAPACGPSYASCLGVDLGAQPTTCCPNKVDFLSTLKVPEFGLKTTFELQGVSVNAGSEECVQNSLAEALVVLTASFEEQGSAVVTSVRTNECTCTQEQGVENNRCELILPDPEGTTLCYPALAGIYEDELCTDINSFSCFCPEEKPGEGIGSGCTPEEGSSRSAGALLATKISVYSQSDAWQLETLLLDMFNGEASAVRNSTQAELWSSLSSNGCDVGEPSFFMRSYPVAENTPALA